MPFDGVKREKQTTYNRYKCAGCERTDGTFIKFLGGYAHKRCTGLVLRKIIEKQQQKENADVPASNVEVEGDADGD